MDFGDKGLSDWLRSVRGREEVAWSTVTKAPPFSQSQEKGVPVAHLMNAIVV